MRQETGYGYITSLEKAHQFESLLVTAIPLANCYDLPSFSCVTDIYVMIEMCGNRCVTTMRNEQHSCCY